MSGGTATQPLVTVARRCDDLVRALVVDPAGRQSLAQRVAGQLRVPG